MTFTSQMFKIFTIKLGRSFKCVISFDLSPTINKSVPNHVVNNISETTTTKRNYNIWCCRRFASMWIMKAKQGDIFPPAFQSGFSKSIRTISKGSRKCFHILKGFKVFQSSRNCFKCTEKHIGFSHGNLLSNSSPAKTWLSTRSRIFSFSTSFSLSLSPHRYHFDGKKLRSSESKEPQYRLLKIEANAVIIQTSTIISD